MLPLIDRYLVREVLKTLLAIIGTLMLIVTGLMLLRIFEEANLGALNANEVMRFLLLEMSRTTPSLMPPAFFLAVIVAIGRMARDSELIALNAGGVGAWRIYRALLYVALPLAALTLWLELEVKPDAVARIQEIRTQQLDRGYQIAGLQAGRFYQQFNGAVTLYIGEIHSGRRLRDIFIHDRRGPVERLVVSDEGFHQLDEASGDHLVTLLNGRRYDGNPGAADYSIGEFRTYRIWIESRILKPPGTKRSGKPTGELIGSSQREDRAELESRFAGPLAIFTLGIIAVPLSFTSPRQRSTGRVTLAFLTYLCFFNLQRFAESWLERGVTPMWLGSLWYQLLVLAAVFIILYSDSYWSRRMARRLGLR